MPSGWRYRVASVAGVVVLTAAAVAVANNAALQSAISVVPVFERLTIDPPSRAEFAFEALLTVLVVSSALLPLYKPQPRRILDIVAMSQKRVFVAVFALATIGYFDYTYRLPRLSVLLLTPLLLVALPAWFVWIRKRPAVGDERTLIVGDNVDIITKIIGEIDGTLLGCLCPTNTLTDRTAAVTVSDGGLDAVERLGGLSRIHNMLVQYDVDTVVLAFERADREEFFGTLDACYEHGVTVKVHRDHAGPVLISDTLVDTLVDVDIEPWDIQDYVLKRAFDIAFAGFGLLVLSPLLGLIALAIKAEDGGSILYTQQRTAVFGETFDIYKFRSMIENAESETGPTISEEDAGGVDPRVTRVGRVLRKTHLDEIPQLWAVLRGDMSVVGPRPERPELDADIQDGVVDWKKRWFVKPGLTGLAQVNDVTGADPEQKIRYDLQYVKRQSVTLDLKLVLRQIWLVVMDVGRLVAGRYAGGSDER